MGLFHYVYARYIYFDNFIIYIRKIEDGIYRFLFFLIATRDYDEGEIDFRDSPSDFLFLFMSGENEVTCSFLRSYRIRAQAFFSNLRFVISFFCYRFVKT